ncbi:hypothetical protein ACFE04_026623 [Oxalis oulophora]
MGFNESSKSGPESEPEEDLEMVESEVKQMAVKILEYRDTLPDQLKTSFTSLLSSQRPLTYPHQDSGEPAETSRGAAITDKEQKTNEKISLLKAKISSNISAMPVVLKRMKECISRIDKLDSYDGIIHPAFKKKRTS